MKSCEAFKGWLGAVGFGRFHQMRTMRMLKIRGTNMEPALLERRPLAPKERSDLWELIERES